MFWLGMLDVLMLVAYIVTMVLTEAIIANAFKYGIPIFISISIVMMIWSLVDSRSKVVYAYKIYLLIKLFFMMLFMPILAIRMDNQFFGQAICRFFVDNDAITISNTMT